MIIAFTNEQKDREIPHRYCSIYENRGHALKDLAGSFIIVDNTLDLYCFNLNENTAMIIDGVIIDKDGKEINVPK